ncbi:KpsF/GutQ family sugar-phosphate isomerase [Marinomonas mediterranea]|jgi:KpsF/GutQ family protein|uniref:Arabinose 5-phosphate isomerase n=1 Tax=Marinomonas mediterranea (strain ATCC 700492 / JCM 21426 / NBRC 103028 / MMB-1) TaxID=717774 RepID=F2K4U9_MARM1|nr:KpsF/GutQ family sugar-phosphate isomerase [Marinomonas mediterranea]ADZ92592.1 KpsF/GutQ family protein [Marinomonas mediterranea MMB-1]WCN10535.1 KpsF/GutQ family sugar-phosphate isomerase [Marinomonas mediterranea]WCN14585.1 KpsF/GutQ family sugar-phosphate isomerase [Marinomonas mediterranea]WCN18634.1 KpsF/GutQ family sugar-phosphate isomerase [Marinomonas mediterranea MMB-1]
MNHSSHALRLSDDAILQSARTTLDTQANALTGLSQRLSNEFSQAVKMILATSGRVIVCGMGKSGLIGKKIAATLASTGTPSFFLHPGEAFHGDLGMIQKEDLVLLISYSGETEEVIRLLPSLSNFGNPLIAIAGNPSSTLATHSQCFLNIAVDREACPNNLAPTTSTTLTAAIGDALAVALMECRDFQPQDFARFHPGGSLGRKLLTRVKDLMHKDNLPTCAPSMPLSDAISVMTTGRMGVVLIEDEKRIVGIFTDGDLRRALLTKGGDIMSKSMAELMTANPKTIHESVMIVEAEERMINEKITLLVVVDDSDSVVGLLEIYDR